DDSSKLFLFPLLSFCFESGGKPSINGGLSSSKWVASRLLLLPLPDEIEVLSVNKLLVGPTEPFPFLAFFASLGSIPNKPGGGYGGLGYPGGGGGGGNGGIH